ncbi:MAG: PilZ domain-containing protein [Pseudomonadales bacterium]|nr:PilZ domain-containing protein [Pseudomonadales bacterium]
MTPANRFSFDEKRSFMRLHIGTDLSFTDAQGQTYTGRCLNLSASGMLLETDTEVAAGDLLSVTLPSTHPAIPSLASQTQVIRVTPGETQRFMVALEIQKVMA